MSRHKPTVTNYGQRHTLTVSPVPHEVVQESYPLQPPQSFGVPEYGEVGTLYNRVSVPTRYTHEFGFMNDAPTVQACVLELLPVEQEPHCPTEHVRVRVYCSAPMRIEKH